MSDNNWLSALYSHFTGHSQVTHKSFTDHSRVKRLQSIACRDMVSNSWSVASGQFDDAPVSTDAQHPTKDLETFPWSDNDEAKDEDDDEDDGTDDDATYDENRVEDEDWELAERGNDPVFTQFPCYSESNSTRRFHQTVQSLSAACRRPDRQRSGNHFVLEARCISRICPCDQSSNPKQYLLQG